ncbi:MAG: D-aminoacylase [Candidatus Anammoximicrobium sp.]|nr:D-aminoacylase [Candidatus Anammoximicrobium sp.]
MLVRVLAALVLMVSVSVSAADKTLPLDVLIRGGQIVDGSGAPPYLADVGLRAGKIVRIGRLADVAAQRTIDAAGLTVAPGFVDMMGQTATPFLDHPESALNLLGQGITTIMAGEGASAAPRSPGAKGARWTTMAEYLTLLEKTGIPLNVAQNVGHTQVRSIVLGSTDRQPSPAELERMKDLVREAMEAGAVGLSTALIYPPATYARTEELVALAKVAGEHGGRYFTHMRNEGDQLLEGLEEALQIGLAAGAPVHVFHLKAAGQENWGKMELALARINKARAAGQQVAADIYPYINNGLGLRSFVHPRHFAQGHGPFLSRLADPATRAAIRREMESEPGWENWFRHVGYDWNRVVLGSMSSAPWSDHNGRSLAEIARALDRDPWDVFFDLLKTSPFAMPQSMSEDNKIRAMREPFVMFCTDVGPGGSSHPRGHGSMPRVLGHYVRRLGALSWERAVAQMSAVAADELFAPDRGRIAEGKAADLVVFDPQRVGDKATFAEPRAASVGIQYVLVNGQLVFESGAYTGAKPGKVLRGPGYRARRASE